MELMDFFKINSKVAAAFSGGVDSAYLLYAAAKYAREVRAYYVSTAFQPRFELEDARAVAERLGVALTVIGLDILSDEQIVSNPADRCYYCKSRIFSAILGKAKADGFDILLDGTNASDDPGDRPGTRALRELNVLSPLRECGLTKADIRALSKQAGLPVWNKPAYACLATRIPTGMRISAEDLERTETAEKFLWSLGFRDFRVRTAKDGGAKIEITGNQFPLFTEKREMILRELKKHYPNVTPYPERRYEQ